MVCLQKIRPGRMRTGRLQLPLILEHIGQERVDQQSPANHQQETSQGSNRSQESPFFSFRITQYQAVNTEGKEDNPQNKIRIIVRINSRKFR